MLKRGKKREELMLSFLLSFLKVFNTRPIWSNYGQDSKRSQLALKDREWVRQDMITLPNPHFFFFFQKRQREILKNR